jgi:2-oxoglutarate dehydrogenase E1 component
MSRLLVSVLSSSRRLQLAATTSSFKSRSCKSLAPFTYFRLSPFSTAAIEEDEHENETFLSGTSSVYAEQMYELYLHDPTSVHESWKLYFDNLGEGKAYTQEDYSAPTAAVNPNAVEGPGIGKNMAQASDSLGVSHLIRAYQVSGHLAASLDPLGLYNKEAFPYRPSNLYDLSKTDGWPAELTPEYHGFNEADMDRKLNFLGKSSGGAKGYLEELASSPQKVTMRGVLETLRKTYCGNMGVEYMHIGEPDKVNWIRERVENPRWLNYDAEKKQHIYERLCFADTFENFLATKFNTTKRFGLDGGEAVVPGLKDAIDRASELGAHSFVIGMPHRGRLNILANVMRKPMPLIFAEFQGTHYKTEDYNIAASWNMSGDVKYHMGSSMDRTYPDGRRIHLSLVANPSHLECVNPVVAGKVRAKQYYCGNRPEDVRAVVPVMLHGDAAFAGQGVVYETMQMAKVADFDVGGTIHVIVDNQIGFTVR